jgi:hypothetical protein
VADGYQDYIAARATLSLSGTSTSATYRNTSKSDNLFCCGHVQTANQNIVAAGGHGRVRH